jgi:glutamyl-tRNA synthetase
MTVVTRFAPSPTGMLHIGSARTALFNFLFAKHNKGKFLLRIEDTDKARSTKESEQSILNGLAWLDLFHDEEIVFQSHRQERHAEIAKELVKRGRAYYCYTPLEEIQTKRDEYAKEGKVYQFKSEWRDKAKTPEAHQNPVIRLKIDNQGETVINDLVQGKVTVKNDHIDDFVLLRSDGTPTYMLAVVVDDHDMGVTHVIRGDDHLNNAFRQWHIFDAMGWSVPEFAHIPLIHGQDGAKLSKRHGALSVEDYKAQGYLPEALNNYLLRLGWSHGDDEIISRDQAIEWFDTKNIGKAAARMNFDKMLNINAHYIKSADNDYLIELLKPLLSVVEHYEHSRLNVLKHGLDSLKSRVKTLNELSESSVFYLVSADNLSLTVDAQTIIDNLADGFLIALGSELENINDWQEDVIKDRMNNFAEKQEKKLKDIMQPLRVALTGSTSSPSVFEIMTILGKEETLARINKLL